MISVAGDNSEVGDNYTALVHDGQFCFCHISCIYSASNGGIVPGTGRRLCVWGLTASGLHCCFIILYSLYLSMTMPASPPLLYPLDLHFGVVVVWMCMI
jgi:hypothetical protein